MKPTQTNKSKFLPLLAVLAYAAAPLHGARPGDPAAPLEIAEWIKGGAVDLAAGKGKTIHVIEFWATWCPPCRESIPHLSALQKKFRNRGVVVVGVSAEEAGPVKKFVSRMGERMEYAVGIDKGGKTTAAYMDAFGEGGIPAAFIIDKNGAVVWHGHPKDGLEQTLEAVLAGNFQPAADDDGDGEDDDGDRETLMDTYLDAASRDPGGKEAAAAGEKALLACGTDPAKLSELALAILDAESLVHRDYALALRAAQKAAGDPGGGMHVPTLARALFMNGRHKEAIATQEKAIAACDDPALRLELEETLATFRQPPADPGPDDDTVTRRLIAGSADLIAAGRTVPCRQLLRKAGLAPVPVELAPTSRNPVPGEELYTRAKSSVLAVACLKKGRAGKDWDFAVASGFVIGADGVFVTNFHVVSDVGADALTAMTDDGKIYPVVAVLAVAPAADIAICRLGGVTGLKPVPLAPAPNPGAPIRIISHPGGEYNTFTEGVLSRRFIHRIHGKSLPMVATTAEFAVGSSGAPLFDERGNAVGMVCSTSAIYGGPPSPEDIEDDPGDLQMITRMCVPADAILKLVATPETGKK